VELHLLNESKGVESVKLDRNIDGAPFKFQSILMNSSMRSHFAAPRDEAFTATR
jgi:hypothetical protein